MPESQDAIHICLLEDPRISWQGMTVLVKPPLAFQVLVATALSPDRKVSRPKLAVQLFPHVAQAQRSGQLRLAIKKLRHLLDSSGMSELIEVTATEVQILPPCQTDLDAMLENGNLSLTELRSVAHPVLSGSVSKFAESVRAKTKNWIESNVELIYAQVSSVETSREFQAILQQLRTIYPHSVIICAYLCATYKNLNLIEEFSREIIGFEGDWIDAFGVTDKPDIASLVERILSGSKLQSASSPGELIVLCDPHEKPKRVVK